MYDQSKGQSIASREEVKDLVQLSLNCVGKTYIVLDGLDECDDCDDLVHQLRKVSEIPSVRLVLFSRPTVTTVPELIPHLTLLSIGLSNNADIDHYLRNATMAMKEKRLLPQATDYAEVAKSLTHRADGMFLWARLMVTYLDSPALYPAEEAESHRCHYDS